MGKIYSVSINLFFGVFLRKKIMKSKVCSNMTQYNFTITSHLYTRLIQRNTHLQIRNDKR